MKNTWLILLIFCLFISCQSNSGTGAVIIYGDVIGSYDGQCADYNVATSEMTNIEDATLSVSAVNTQVASVKTSCSRFSDQELDLKSSSASEFTFEKVVSVSTIVTLRYLAENDSLILSQSEGGDNNMIFSGVRR